MSSNDLASLLPLVVLLVLGYLLFIRPARKRAQEVSALQNALSTGDEVMLTSGIFATVVDVLDDKVRVVIADGVIVTVHRGAIAKIIRDVVDDTPYDDAPYEDDAPAVHDDDPRDDPADGQSPDKPGAN